MSENKLPVNPPANPAARSDWQNAWMHHVKHQSSLDAERRNAQPSYYDTHDIEIDAFGGVCQKCGLGLMQIHADRIVCGKVKP